MSFVQLRAALVVWASEQRDYRPGQSCPSCGRGAWLIGRTMAECAHCGEALDLPKGTRR